MAPVALQCPAVKFGDGHERDSQHSSCQMGTIDLGTGIAAKEDEMTAVSTTQSSIMPALVAPLTHGRDELVCCFILRPEVAEEVVEIGHRSHPLLCCETT